MQFGDVAGVMERLDGVRQTTAVGLTQWRFHGRVVARQLDDTHVVIRADFDYRDTVVREFPDTFSVPRRDVGLSKFVLRPTAVRRPWREEMDWLADAILDLQT